MIAKSIYVKNYPFSVDSAIVRIGIDFLNFIGGSRPLYVPERKVGEFARCSFRHQLVHVNEFEPLIINCLINFYFPVVTEVSVVARDLKSFLR